MKLFFVGSKPWTAAHLPCPSMISINSLHDYANINIPGCCLIDSGAFTTVSKYGGYPQGSISKYVSQILKLNSHKVLGFVSQDYMCESFILSKTGLTLAEHQRYTIYRYKAIRKLVPSEIYIMPVLQGYEPEDYLSHLIQYGDLINPGMWVGVGSVCKRNRNPLSVLPILKKLNQARPDLKLHGFGLKLQAIQNPEVRSLLFSSDSFAWSFDSFHKNKNNDCPKLAENYSHQVYQHIYQDNFDYFEKAS
ncbi:hypothetical protein G7B40_042195 [Aetokthonos hydrillicola Thurmond2011]|jgi:hypothetical protein|uniref:DeoxyPurine in DNA protein A domain-containing protein n=1 Tax=Aetokthonos hydrillicola Thurmond2011 TaxID=2712845 RepID=A0AAP5IFW3_9CYAN|nr:hypothetical protein [Aetokthonos hydrillicola]MBW4591140.1 hypothetical protein [Aetokthonos hydrillicola CCALA 1050]MDR9900986.1 hypothetical protein [Aetokthonos hydrillicola Thurmond2011]